MFQEKEKKVVIVVSRRGGNTEKLALAILDGCHLVGGVTAEIYGAGEVTNDNLLEADALIVGSPVYLGSMSATVKLFFDNTYTVRGRLRDKIGAAFATADDSSGGKETTIMSIIQAMLVHQMIIVGDPIESGGYYGVASIGAPGPEEIVAGQALGKRVAQIAVRLA